MLPIQVYSSENNYDFRVQLKISADDSIAGEIKSYLSRELRALGDVIQTKENIDYKISVIAIETLYEGGQKIGGSVLSVIVLEPFPNSVLSFYAKDEEKEMLLKITKNLYYNPYRWVQSGSTKNLFELCQKLIAHFDSTVLQPRRDKYQQFLDDTKKNSKPANAEK